VCLTAIERRGSRPLPSGLGGPANDPEAPLEAASEVPWLQPLPDALVTADREDPAAVTASRAGVRLAFVAALQYLSARQRAMLILRDVLEWTAADVAELLGTTTTAVNSGLRRARAQLAQAMPAEDELAMATPQMLSRPTPCPAWDLAMLLGHITDSVDVLREAISAGRIGIPADSRPGLFADPVPPHGPAGPGDELVAFLGRRPFRGDSEGSTWSA
jgi:Sigma-70, region 4/Mycothiol maleylpyruvate isomerase N-terminal domain